MRTVETHETTGPPPSSACSRRTAWRSGWTAASIWGVAVAAFAWIRAGLWLDAFPNPDIAGIAYEADRIREGSLPYLDTVEVKPPGTFWIAAASFSVLGRSVHAVQAVQALLLLAGAAGVAAAATALARRAGRARGTARIHGAAAGAVYLVYVPLFSWNYMGFAAPLAAVALGAAAWGGAFGSSASWALSGAAAAAGFACKQSAGGVMPAVLAAWFTEPRRHRGRAAVGFCAGAGLVGAALAVPYGIRGNVQPLVAGLFPLGVAADYHGAQPDVSVFDVAAQFVGVFPGAVAVWGAGLLGRLLPAGRAGKGAAPVIRGERHAEWIALSAVAGAVLGVAAGGRFYVHHLVLYVPAVAVALTTPAQVRGLSALWAAAASGGRRWGRGLAAVTGSFALLVAGVELTLVLSGERHHYEAMPRRLADGRTAPQAAGAHIRERTGADATIQVWGWTAWPVYFWADRPAPGPVYKPMGVLTTFNTNTAFRLGAGPRFRPGAAADAFLRRLRRRPPAYFVYSPSMVRAFGARVSPLQEFRKLRRFLEARYVAEAAYGDLLLLRRVR